MVYNNVNSLLYNSKSEQDIYLTFVYLTHVI